MRERTGQNAMLSAFFFGGAKEKPDSDKGKGTFSKGELLSLRTIVYIPKQCYNLLKQFTKHTFFLE